MKNGCHTSTLNEEKRELILVNRQASITKSNILGKVYLVYKESNVLRTARCLVTLSIQNITSGNLTVSVTNLKEKDYLLDTEIILQHDNIGHVSQTKETKNVIYS